MPVIIYALFGLFLGLLAQFLMPNGWGFGWLAALLGIDGALVGLQSAQYFLRTSGGGTTLFMALLTSCAFLALYRFAFEYASGSGTLISTRPPAQR